MKKANNNETIGQTVIRLIQNDIEEFLEIHGKEKISPLNFINLMEQGLDLIKAEYLKQEEES